MVANFLPKRSSFHVTRVGLLGIVLLISSSALAELTMRLNSLQVEENERVLLTLRIDRNDAQKEPDFSALNKDFTILNRPSRSSQFQSINGRITAWTDWKVYIQPKNTGRVVVPPITYEGETSLPQSILVTPLDPSVKRDLQQRVFFETTTTPENPYVQAQVTFVRRLLYSEGTQIYGEIPDIPQIESAVVVQLGTPTSRKVERFGQRYSMIEQRYAIFPESSGSLTIPGANVTGSVRSIVNQRIRRNSLSVNADPITIDVRPIPANYPSDEPWFPAEDVQVIDAWDTDPLVFNVGEPISQSVIVSSSGSTGSIIPPVVYELPDSHFRIYPEQPDISDNPSANNLLGVRSQNFSLIPIAAGSITLPEVKMTWWDTTSDQLQVARLPSRLINIGGESVVDAPITSDVQATATDASGSTDKLDQAEQFPTFGAWLRKWGWLIVAAVLAGGLGWLYKSGRLVNSRSLDALRARLFTSSPRATRNALLRSVAADSPSAIRQALNRHLNALEERGRPATAAVVHAIHTLLSQAAYAPQERPLERTQLHKLVQELRQPEATQVNQPLPALYKQRA